MQHHLLKRRGAIWLELLLVLAALALILQLFPSFPQKLLSALDVRSWSAANWLQMNVVALVVLLFFWLFPKMQFVWRECEQNPPPQSTRKPFPAEFHKYTDPRVSLRAEEHCRAQWRRRFIASTAAVFAGLSVLSLAIAYWPSGASGPTARIEPLFTNQEGKLANLSAMAGGYFRVRDDRDIEVTHVGFFDSGDDGLQLTHRVGVFEVVEGPPAESKSVCEVEVPFGLTAKLQDGYRWVQLPQPLRLKAGTTYMLAGDRRTESRDLVFCELEQGGPIRPHWSSLFVSSQPDSTRGGLSNSKGWPDPREVHSHSGDGTIFGAANLGCYEAAN